MMRPCQSQRLTAGAAERCQQDQEGGQAGQAGGGLCALPEYPYRVTFDVLLALLLSVSYARRTERQLSRSGFPRSLAET